MSTDWEENRFLEVVKAHKEVLVIGVVGVVMVVLGVGEWRRSAVAEEPVVIVEKDEDQVIGSVVVDVSGAVNRPGVYRFEIGARVGEAIEAAGGFADEADQEWVARNLNLALELSDGVKVYVPVVGEVEVDAAAEGVEVDVLGSKVVNVNTAQLAELEGLWGVGEARARAIVENRPYSDLVDLEEKASLPGNVIEENGERIGF